MKNLKERKKFSSFLGTSCAALLAAVLRLPAAVLASAVQRLYNRVRAAVLRSAANNIACPAAGKSVGFVPFGRRRARFQIPIGVGIISINFNPE